MLATHRTRSHGRIVHVQIAQRPDRAACHRAAAAIVVSNRRFNRVCMTMEAFTVGHRVLTGRVHAVVVAVDARHAAQHMHALIGVVRVHLRAVQGEQPHDLVV